MKSIAGSWAVALIVSFALLGCSDLPWTQADDKEESAAALSAAEIQREALTQLEPGMPLSLMLLTPLSSGGSPVGADAVFVVAEDVEVDGVIAIPAGTVIPGEVSRSRRATAFTGLVRQPARLEVRFQEFEVQGVRLSISPEAERLRDRPFEFTQSNIREEPEPRQFDNVWQDPDLRPFVEELGRRWYEQGRLDDLATPNADQIFRDIASRVESPELERFTREVTDPLSALDRIRRGDVSVLTPSEVMLAMQALQEVGRLANGVDRRLRGIFKGSNLNAPVGMPVDVYLREIRA